VALKISNSMFENQIFNASMGLIYIYIYIYIYIMNYESK